ncbi:MAG TPA: PIN domain-containing protein [Acidimicrobiia bacterium]|nr:PIN domain-containing protein [Acidimicrobiia bacterium]
MTILVDTSVWYAALDRSDRSHSRAARILAEEHDLLVTDHVMVEAHRLADHRLGRKVADAYLSTLLSGAVDIEVVNRTDLEHASRIRQAFPDQGFSLVDCTSFSVMERRRLDAVATFDVDFSIYRYGPGLRRAFQIVN